MLSPRAHGSQVTIGRGRPESSPTKNDLPDGERLLDFDPKRTFVGGSRSTLERPVSVPEG